MQNKQCTMQFSHHPMTDCIASPRAAITELPDSCFPQPTPIYIQSMMSMVWNTSVSSLGLAAWLCCLPAPAHLLVSLTWETEKTSLIS